MPEHAQPVGESREFQPNGRSTRLVVLLHAYTMGPQDLDTVARAVREAMPDADLFIPRMPASVFSLADPVRITSGLVQRIDDLWQRRTAPDGAQGYESVTLVGHSLGALMARKMYVYACGELPGTPFEAGAGTAGPRPWAARVERLVLLAGMNRGWAISHHMSLLRSVAWTVGTGIGNLLAMCGRQPLIFHIRKGAPFITNLRLQWLAMRRSATESGIGAAPTIQLLGSIDDMVGPEDNVDLVTGADFVYLEVPYSGHANVIRMDSSFAGEARRRSFLQALTSSHEELRRYEVAPADLPALVTTRPEVTDVIFVIHGIRDLGYWTQKIAWRVKARGRAARRIFETETSSYGYFPMLSFLLPWRRRNKVEWLMDQYVEDKARFPNAEFSFVGHSNGTYLLARALRAYPSCRFRHVVFAGSVVRTDYDWQDAIDRGQVRAVLNYVATSDWVVAVFPKALQTLRFQDLGSAGHDGFLFPAGTPAEFQIEYIRGSHDAALNEANWDALAEFVVSGQRTDPPAALQSSQRAAWAVVLGESALLCWAVLAALLVLGGYGLLHTPWPEWLRTTALLGYLWVILRILTRF